MTAIKIYQHHCLRCNGNWQSSTVTPCICQRCHSPLWNKPYTRPDKLGQEKWPSRMKK